MTDCTHNPEMAVLQERVRTITKSLEDVTTSVKGLYSLSGDLRLLGERQTGFGDRIDSAVKVIEECQAEIASVSKDLDARDNLLRQDIGKVQTDLLAFKEDVYKTINQFTGVLKVVSVIISTVGLAAVYGGFNLYVKVSNLPTYQETEQRVYERVLSEMYKNGKLSQVQPPSGQGQITQ